MGKKKLISHIFFYKKKKKKLTPNSSGLKSNKLYLEKIQD